MVTLTLTTTDAALLRAALLTTALDDRARADAVRDAADSEAYRRMAADALRLRQLLADAGRAA